jgi:hypothetical protein
MLHNMIDWAFEDVRASKLDLKTLQELLDLGEAQATAAGRGVDDALIEEYKTRDPYPIFRSLFLPSGCDDQLSDHRFQLLSNWLCNPPKGSRNIRLFWLLNFLDLKIFFSREKDVADFRIADYGRLIALQENMPRTIKDFTSSQVPIWHSVLANCYMLKFWSGGLRTLIHGWDFAMKAQEHAHKSIEGFRKSHNCFQIALQQRLLSMICLCETKRLTAFAILSSRPLETKQGVGSLRVLSTTVSLAVSVEDQWHELRKTGLKLLSEADGVLSESELEACWEDGLSGIQKRRDLAKRNQSWRANQSSIQLLLEGLTPLTEEETVSLWSMVQKYKARYLAMPIGTHRTNPPELIDKVLASKEYGPPYQRC